MLLEQSGWRYRSGSDTVRQSLGETPQKLSLRILVNGENYYTPYQNWSVIIYDLQADQIVAVLGYDE